MSGPGAPSEAPRSNAAPAAAFPASVIGLLTIAAAMILPYVHVWLQGAEKLVAIHVARRQAQGLIPPEFMYVAREVAENRVRAQGLVDAISVAVALVLLTCSVWLFARWRTVRVPFGDAVRASSYALMAEMAFHALLYVVVWLTFGSEGMRLGWNELVPTDASRLAPAGTLLWTMLRVLSIGAAVRFVTLTMTIRRTLPELSRDGAILVAGLSSITVMTAGIFLQRL